MQKFEVIVEDESAKILNDLLQSLPYVKEVKLWDSIGLNSLDSEISFPSRKASKEATSPEEAETKGSLDELFGLWKDRNISLDKIREQQWARKAK